MPDRGREKIRKVWAADARRREKDVGGGQRSDDPRSFSSSRGFGVVPFRQRAGNFSLLVATSRYVRYYVLRSLLGIERIGRKG